MENLISMLSDITSSTLGVERERVAPATRFVEDLGADSLDCVELMMAFEDAFGVEFPDEAVPDLVSADAVAGYLGNRGAATLAA